MKGYKVKKPFTDRETGQRYAAGETFLGSEARVTELQDGDYLTRTALGPAETPTDGPQETKGVSDGEPGASTGRKPADRSANRKR